MITNQLQRNKLVIYKEYSLYPKIVKDLSFIIHQDVSFDQIQNLLYSNGSKFLTQVKLLDEYKSNSIPDNHISLCLQLVFQSNTQTLQNKELEKIIEKLQALLINTFSVTLRT